MENFLPQYGKRSIRLRPHDPLFLFIIAKPRARHYELKAEQSVAGYPPQGVGSPEP